MTKIAGIFQKKSLNTTKSSFLMQRTEEE